MKPPLHFALASLFLLGSLGVSAQAKNESATAAWERSVVHLDVTRKQYDYTQPWTKRLKNTQKTGIVLSGKEILTTADQMFDGTLVRIQKGGRGKWSIANISWIDYHANLALVTTTDDAFWEGLQPVEWSTPAAAPDALQILRWREGKLETRKAEFGQFNVDTGRLSFAPRVQLEMSSEIQGVGWGEPVISDTKVVGILTEQTGTKCTAFPSSFIRPILDAHRKGAFRGLGFLDFYWQPAENPANLALLKLKGEPRGVIVIEVPTRKGVASILKPHDVLLQVDGFDIDTQGDYVDPNYGHLSLENLATRGKWAGDDVPMKIWRDGQAQEIQYRLPKADYASTLVPDAVFDQEPEFVILGGLVFQPLTDSFLQSWGPEWKRRSPFRLYYYNNQNATPERPALVFLSQVLPDIYNLGYQELRYLVVDEVNGQKVSRLSDLRAALEKPQEGFHHILFMQSDSLRRIVLSADDLKPATERVLQRFGITADSSIAPTAATNQASAARP